MAFKPIGVAALSSPSILTLIFMSIVPVTGWFLGILGNRRVKRGLTSLAKICMAPAFSPIFRIPNQRDRIPVSPSAISKAVLDISKALCMVVLKIPVSPKNNH
jgi:hypothetical protein